MNRNDTARKPHVGNILEDPRDGLAGSTDELPPGCVPRFCGIADQTLRLHFAGNPCPPRRHGSNLSKSHQTGNSRRFVNLGGGALRVS